MTDNQSRESEAKPFLICSKCQGKVSPNDMFGIIGESYLKCKCGSLFMCHALTEWYERGYEQGKQNLQTEIKSILNLNTRTEPQEGGE